MWPRSCVTGRGGAGRFVIVGTGNLLSMARPAGVRAAPPAAAAPAFLTPLGIAGIEPERVFLIGVKLPFAATAPAVFPVEGAAAELAVGAAVVLVEASLAHRTIA